MPKIPWITFFARLKQKYARPKQKYECFDCDSPFAGGFYGKVYDKRKTKYPVNSLFAFKGNAMKIYKFSLSRKQGLKLFYSNKILQVLFPGNVIKIRAIAQGPCGVEIHSERVPAHPELEKYMSLMVDRWKRADPIDKKFFHDFNSKECEGAERVVRQNPQVQKLAEEFEKAGFYPGLENYTNVSVANPEKPVFFEVYLRDTGRLKAHLEHLKLQKRLTKEQEKIIERYLKKITQLGRVPAPTM